MKKLCLLFIVVLLLLTACQEMSPTPQIVTREVTRMSGDAGQIGVSELSCTQSETSTPVIVIQEVEKVITATSQPAYDAEVELERLSQIENPCQTGKIAFGFREAEDTEDEKHGILVYSFADDSHSIYYTENYPDNVVWHPHGDKVSYINTNRDEYIPVFTIATLNLNTEETTLIDLTHPCRNLSWSPNSRYLAFKCSVSLGEFQSETNTYIYDSSTGVIESLGNKEHTYELPIVWLSNDSLLIYSSESPFWPDTTYWLFKVNINSSAHALIYSGTERISIGHLSSNGDNAFFPHISALNWKLDELTVINLETNEAFAAPLPEKVIPFWTMFSPDDVCYAYTNLEGEFFLC